MKRHHKIGINLLKTNIPIWYNTRVKKSLSKDCAIQSGGLPLIIFRKGDVDNGL